MTDIKQWIKGIESLEPPGTWEPRSAFSSSPPRDHVRRAGTILVAAAISLAAITFAVVAFQPTGSLPPAGTSHLVAPAWLRVLAQQLAANNGDTRPDTGLWGIVTIAQADPLVGLTPTPQDTQAREFLVVLTGHFVCSSCKVPAGAQVPRGSAIVFTVKPGSRSVSDFSVGEVPSVANLHLRPLRPGSLFSSEATPWTFPMPASWTDSTIRSAPNPDLKAGVLITRATDAPYRFDFGSPAAHSEGGASEALGRDAVVVQIELLWSPADKDPTWLPTDGPTTIGSPSVWHDDASNPGWASRERRVCRGGACVQVLEWHGPDASTEMIGAAQSVVESIELKTSWAGTATPAPLASTHASSPRPAGSGDAVAIDGVPFKVCRPMTIPGDFGSGLDTAWVFEEERVPGAGCIGSEGFQRLGIGSALGVQLLSDRITDLVGDDAYKVWPYAAPDLNGDGVAEIAVAKQGDPSTSRTIWFFQITRNDKLTPVLAACGSACDPTPFSATIGSTPDSDGTTTQQGLYCEGQGASELVIEWSATSDDPLFISETKRGFTNGVLDVVSRRSYRVASVDDYPPSGSGDLCGSPTNEP